MNKPNHVAIIMDGNGRWAKEKGLPSKLEKIILNLTEKTKNNKSDILSFVNNKFL